MLRDKWEMEMEMAYTYNTYSYMDQCKIYSEEKRGKIVVAFVTNCLKVTSLESLLPCNTVTAYSTLFDINIHINVNVHNNIHINIHININSHNNDNIYIYYQGIDCKRKIVYHKVQEG